MREAIQKTAIQAARAFHAKNNHLNREDLESEALLIMYKAVSSWSPDKGRTMKSWVAFLVHRDLKKQFRDNTLFEEINDTMISSTITNPERVSAFKEELQNVSSTAKRTLDILFSRAIHKKKKNEIKREIKSILRSEGYSWNKIQIAFNELKVIANNIGG